MDFAEAEANFRTLESQLNANQIDLKWYRTALSQIRVTDAQGYVWMMQERTGMWHYWNGQQWVPGTPARPAPPPFSAPPAPAPVVQPTTAVYSTPAPVVQPAPTVYPQPTVKAKPTPAPARGGSGKARLFLQWFVLTAISLALVLLFVHNDALGFILLMVIGSSIYYLVRLIIATRKM